MSEHDSDVAYMPTCCGRACVRTMVFPKAELHCLICGSYFGIFDAPGKIVQTKENSDQREIDQRAFEAISRFCLPTGARLTTCKECELGSDHHRAHATPDELSQSQAAYKALAGGLYSKRDWYKLRGVVENTISGVPLEPPT